MGIPKELRDEARSLGYVASRGVPSGVWLLMDGTTGRTVLKASSAEEIRLALKELEPVVKSELVEESVGWQLAAQPVVEPVRGCVNGHGPLCLCIDENDWIFCAVRTCHQKAGCYGLCQDHYGPYKVLGDFTRHAYAHMASHEGEDVKALKAEAKKVAMKHVSEMRSTGPARQAPPQLGVIGAQVRAVGVAQDEWMIVDRDGNELGRSNDREALIRDFLGED